MEITILENGKYHVIHDGRVDVMTLDEVMFLLSHPAPTYHVDDNYQMRMEEFWDSKPIYPRM